MASWLLLFLIGTLLAVSAVISNGLDKIQHAIGEMADEQRKQTELLDRILEAQPTRDEDLLFDEDVE